MARIKESILGSVTGKLDNLVLRKVNGQTFISVRPRHYRKTKSEKLRKSREGFAKLTAFAVSLNKIDKVKGIWKNKQLGSTRAYGNIYSHNKILINDHTAYNLLILFPPLPSYIIKIKSIELLGTKLLLDFSVPIKDLTEIELIVLLKRRESEKYENFIFTNEVISANQSGIELELLNKFADLMESEFLWSALLGFNSETKTRIWSPTVFLALQ